MGGTHASTDYYRKFAVSSVHFEGEGVGSRSGVGTPSDCETVAFAAAFPEHKLRGWTDWKETKRNKLALGAEFQKLTFTFLLVFLEIFSFIFLVNLFTYVFGKSFHSYFW